MTYDGPERRIHSVLVTKNTEYHMRRTRCVRVRDRRTDQWVDDHQALHRELLAAVSVAPGTVEMRPDRMPVPGDILYFGVPSGHLVTSPVLAVERPPKERVRLDYPPIF